MPSYNRVSPYNYALWPFSPIRPLYNQAEIFVGISIQFTSLAFITNYAIVKLCIEDASLALWALIFNHTALFIVRILSRMPSLNRKKITLLQIFHCSILKKKRTTKRRKKHICFLLPTQKCVELIYN